MTNQYLYNYQQFSPNDVHMDTTSSGSDSTSPLFNNTYISTNSSSSSFGNYSFHTPRLRYYLSKSFDIEDDLEFCPEIPETTSPSVKKFNPYTASVFSPQQVGQRSPPATSATPAPLSPRVHTPRLKKPLEIINPQTKLRVASPVINK